jgi:hypothetical protein
MNPYRQCAQVAERSWFVYGQQYQPILKGVDSTQQGANEIQR